MSAVDGVTSAGAAPADVTPLIALPRRPRGVESVQGCPVDAGAEDVAAGSDTQQLRAVERALALSEARHQAAFWHAPVGQFELDTDAVVRRANPALAALLGVDDPAELVGTRAVDLLVDADARTEHRADMAALLDSPERTHRADRCIRTASGRVLHVAVSTSALRGDDGRVVAVLGSVLDTSEREQVSRELEQARVALECELERSAERGTFLQAVLDTVAVGIVACDADGRLTVFNNTTAHFHGLDADPGLAPESWAERFSLQAADGAVLAPDEVPLVRALRTGAVRDAEMVIAPVGLPPRLVRCDGQALLDATGATVGAVVAMQDITAARAAQRAVQRAHEALHKGAEALAVSEAQFRQAFEHGPMPMCRLDGRGGIAQVNPALRRLLARPTSRVLGLRLPELVVPADREALEVALGAALVSHVSTDLVEVRMQRQDGSTVWCEVAVSAGVDGCRAGEQAGDQDGERYILVQLVDVEDRKAREAALEQAASTDSLTGLPNRAAVSRLMEDRLRDGEHLAVLFADLDGFKGINDRFGHDVGDRVLVEVATRLRGLLREEDVVGRFGGDEFLVVTTSSSGTGVHPLVARAKAALAEPVRTSAGLVVVGISIGAVASRPGEDIAALVRRADARMYADKREKGLICPGLPAESAPRMAELVGTAVSEDRLVVHYQPVVDMSTGQVVGVEALLRMLDREQRLIAPDAFIPLAEETGDIHELGRWVLQTATRQAASWKRRLGDREFGVGVNLSPRQLEEPDLPEHVDDALRDSGLDAAALVLELTERLLASGSSEVVRQMHRLRDRGIHLACDDFGAGHSSVRYLLEYPLDIIKIDRAWTVLAPQATPHGKLARGLLRLATSSGLSTVAEGVERPEERDVLLEAGCTLGQGWLLGRPMPAEAMTALLLPPD